MLIGEYQHTIDEKGRLTVPAKLRDALGDRFILTKGLDGCLFGYPVEEWKQLEAKLRELPLTKADVRAFVRLLLAGASECELDRQGRFVLPNNLRAHADIDKDVIITGVSTRIEIWSRQRWEEYRDKAEKNFEGVAEGIEGLGF
ncbi:MAG TPA: division/cell wall cluster transcriptional repressor MraZ [Firmicutes bacterium]|nr:division/cell wall cluster transcriptional repressor MraZ [Bacillota bacterium]